MACRAPQISRAGTACRAPQLSRGGGWTPATACRATLFTLTLYLPIKGAEPKSLRGTWAPSVRLSGLTQGGVWGPAVQPQRAEPGFPTGPGWNMGPGGGGHWWCASERRLNRPLAAVRTRGCRQRREALGSVLSGSDRPLTSCGLLWCPLSKGHPVPLSSLCRTLHSSRDTAGDALSPPPPPRGSGAMGQWHLAT